MGFIGEVNRLGDGLGAAARHRHLARACAPGAVEAMIERVVYLGFEVRVELQRRDGSRVWAQVQRDEAERLELSIGQIVDTRARDARTFPAESKPTAPEPATLVAA